MISPTPACTAPPYSPTPRNTTTVTHNGHGSASTVTFGLRTDRNTTGSITRPNTRSNVSSVRRVMPNDPINEPAMIGIRIGVALDSPLTPSLRNAVAAAAFDVRIPTRFDPFALLPGTPASTSSGTVRIDPPPATALISPAAPPPTTSNSASHHSTTEILTAQPPIGPCFGLGLDCLAIQTQTKTRAG